MKTKQNTYSQQVDKVDVIINNNSSSKLEIDKKYSIEYYEKDYWEKIELDFAVTDSLIILHPSQPVELSLYLHPNQYHYGIGKYRIHKTISLNDEEYNLYTEFNIQ